ncbi:uncharacterized protein LOC127877472 isoform X2 [Dreissena polymorpha]|nr:uncharacterized protein LOC127877472 isoform X2 [Dreissena polymorpha]
MEIQADEEKVKEKEVLKKNQGFWKDERRARSGRRREHPEALTIPSLKEDPFDHKEPTKPTTAPVFSAAPGGKSAVSMRLEREKSTFIEPPTDPKTSDAVFEKASHLWNYKTQTFWGGGV